MSLSSGKTRWTFPPASIFHRSDGLGLPAGARFAEPQELDLRDPPASDDYAAWDAPYDEDAAAYAEDALARSVRSKAHAEPPPPHAPAHALLPPPSPAPPPPPRAAPWLVLVTTRYPADRVFAVAAEDGRLAWQLRLPDGQEVAGLSVSQHGPSGLLLLAVAAAGDPAGGPGGAPGSPAGLLMAVSADSGAVKWCGGRERPGGRAGSDGSCG
jgi:hypothetical protein